MFVSSLVFSPSELGKPTIYSNIHGLVINNECSAKDNCTVNG